MSAAHLIRCARPRLNHVPENSPCHRPVAESRRPGTAAAAGGRLSHRARSRSSTRPLRGRVAGVSTATAWGLQHVYEERNAWAGSCVYKYVSSTAAAAASLGKAEPCKMSSKKCSSGARNAARIYVWILIFCFTMQTERVGTALCI